MMPRVESVFSLKPWEPPRHRRSGQLWLSYHRDRVAPRDSLLPPGDRAVSVALHITALA